MKKTSGDAGATISRRASKWALLIFVPCALLIAYAIYDWYLGMQLEKKSRTAQGIITKIESHNHEQFDYEYSVGSVTYSGGEIIAGASLYQGKHVQVTYDPDHPETSTLGSFGALSTRPAPILFILVMGCMFYFVLRRFLIKQMELNANAYD